MKIGRCDVICVLYRRKSNMSSWTVVRSKRAKRAEKRVEQNLPVSNIALSGKELEKWLKDNLHTYGDGRFSTIEEATGNLCFNMGGGLPPSELSQYEVALLQYRIGEDWYTALGYE